MRRFPLVIAITLLAACAGDGTAPAAPEDLSDVNIELVQQYDATSAAAVDRAGIGGSEFPDSLKLTAEQKAKIQALHEAWRAANAADLAALAAIEAEAKAAIAAGKSRAEVMAILAKAEPIRLRLATAYAKLQLDIMAVYTPAQLAWIKGQRPGGDSCRPDVLSSLRPEQVKQIRELKAAFTEAVKGYIETIRAVHEEARAAAQAGASREEIKRILAKADAAMAAITQAERRLAAAILEVLTPEQKANPCLVRALIGG